MSITKFLTLTNGVQDLVSGQETSSGAASGSIPALNSSSFLDTSIGGTGLDSSSAADGTLLIGNGTGFDLNTLTGGTNVTIDNTVPGQITINASGGSSGALTINATPFTSNQILTGAEDNVLIFNITSGSLTATLPSSVLNSGKVYWLPIMETGGGAALAHILTVTAFSGDSIRLSQAGSNTDTSLTFSASAGPVGLIADGAGSWVLFSSAILAQAETNTSSFATTDNNGNPIYQAVPAAHSIVLGEANGVISGIGPDATSGIPVISQGSSSDPIYGTAVVAGGGTGLTSLTAHDLLVGNGTGNVTLVAPSATSGIPLVSGGSSADPSYTTAVVAGGGTGLATLTAHAVLLGEGTSNVAFATVGTAGRVLTDQGSGSDPVFAAPTATPNTVQLTASAAITAGQLVNIYDNAGTANVRPADNTSSSTPANGFAPASISMSATGTIVPFHGPISGLSGLTPGTNYFLGTSGGLTATAPSSSSDVVQTVGIAITASTFQFFAGPVTVIA